MVLRANLNIIIISLLDLYTPSFSIPYPGVPGAKLIVGLSPTAAIPPVMFMLYWLSPEGADLEGSLRVKDVSLNSLYCLSQVFYKYPSLLRKCTPAALANLWWNVKFQNYLIKPISGQTFLIIFLREKQRFWRFFFLEDLEVPLEWEAVFWTISQICYWPKKVTKANRHSNEAATGVLRVGVGRETLETVWGLALHQVGGRNIPIYCAGQPSGY